MNALQHVVVSPWLLLWTGVGLVLFALMLQRLRTARPPAVGRLSVSARRQSSERSHRGKRTTFVTDEEWRAFGEVKAEITGRKGETLVARELARLGLAALHDVILVDSRGLTQIDHLVRGQDAIFVLETKTYAGFISGNPRSMEWTQHVADGTISNSFQNPLRQNHRHRSAVLEVLTDLAVPTKGLIVSAGQAEFDDDLAGAVTPVECLALVFRRGAAVGVDAEVLSQAWERLRMAAVDGEMRRGEHLEAVRARNGRAA